MVYNHINIIQILYYVYLFYNDMLFFIFYKQLFFGENAHTERFIFLLIGLLFNTDKTNW